MANVLTRLIPDLFAARDKVSRELNGYIPAVSTSLSATRAALDEAIVIPVSPQAAISPIIPAMVLTEPADQDIGNVIVKITRSESSAFAYTGEEIKGLDNGPGRLSIQATQIAQAIRKLTNAVEIDIALAAAQGASRVFGIPGTTPFSSNLNDISGVKKLLKDNGAPQGDLQLVMDTTTGVNLYNLTQLTNVNEAGDESLLRQGLIGARPLNGFSLRETGNGAQITSASVTGTVTVTGVNAIGSTAIGVTTAAGASVTLVIGQFVTFAGDSNKYVVAASVTIGASTTGTITIAKEGLLIATAGSEAVTGGGAYSVNSAFDRDAIQLITRLPAIPPEGDDRDDMMVIQDPISGLAFEVSFWKGQRKNRYEVALSWGVKVIASRHVVSLAG